MAALTAPAFNARPSERSAPAALPGDVRLMRASANLLLVLALLAFAVLAVNKAINRHVFALRGIHVEGEVARNSVSTIRANAMPKLAGNFFSLDLGAARRAFESVPWVRQAVVRRVWPNQLWVNLEEHRAVAVWNDEAAGDRLVNSFGEVFEANLGDVEDDSLPVLAGPAGSSVHVLALLRRLQPVIAQLGGQLGAHPGMQIDNLTLSGRGSWHAELRSGAEVELGRGTDDELLARAERFVATYADATKAYQRPLEYADLRHRDGYALRLKGITTLPAAAASGAPLKKN